MVDLAADGVLVRGPASEPLAQTDERPTYAMEARFGGRVVPSPGRVLAGALVPGGVVWVRLDGTLLRDDGLVIDHDVVPELAVDVVRGRLAYPRHARVSGGVFVLELASGVRHRVSGELAVADRPLFTSDGRLVVVGARASGIAGVWIVDPNGVALPIAVTNGELRAGRPLGSGFVPPPAYHASMRIEGGALVYDDGHRQRSVSLPEAP